MKTLSEEIRLFLERTGRTQASLARAAGVPQPTLSTLLSGRRKHVTYLTADKLRAAMRRLDVEAAARALGASPR